MGTHRGTAGMHAVSLIRDTNLSMLLFTLSIRIRQDRPKFLDIVQNSAKRWFLGCVYAAKLGRICKQVPSFSRAL